MSNEFSEMSVACFGTSSRVVLKRLDKDAGEERDRLVLVCVGKSRVFLDECELNALSYSCREMAGYLRASMESTEGDYE